MQSSKSVRQPRFYWSWVLALSLCSFLLRQVSYAGSLHLHTLMETIATMLALFAGIMALIRYHTRKDDVFLLLGTGFMGTAFLDGYHATVTSEWFAQIWPSPPPSLTPWSWNASRLFLAVLMVLSWWAWKSKQKRDSGDLLEEKKIHTTVGLLTLATFLVFAFMPLPRAYYRELIFGRPQEFIAAAFFLVALVGYIRKGQWRRDAFEHWIVVSLILGFMSQSLFMPFSFGLFDIMFDTAHLLKIASYVCVLNGMFHSAYGLFRAAEQGASRLAQANEKLSAEFEQRSRAEEELRTLNETLELRVHERTKELKTAQEATLNMMEDAEAARRREETKNKQLRKEIAERKRVEKALKESEEFTRTWLNVTTDGVWDWNLETDEEYLSPRFKALFGYEDHELANHASSWQRLIFPEDLQAALDAFKKHTEENEPFNLPVRYRHKNGSTVWVICRGIAFKDETGKYTRMVGTHTDITKLKQAEEALSENQQRLELALSAGNIGTWSWSYQDDELVWDDRMLAMFGVELEKWEANYEAFIKTLHPEDTKRVDREVKKSLEEKGEYDVDYRVQWPNGTIRHISARGKGFYNQAGAIERVSGICLDITERKLAEKQREQLLSTVEEKNRELEQIVYVTSHDLRSPLVNIQGFSKELLASCSDLNSLFDNGNLPKEVKQVATPILHEEIPESLQIIQTSTAKMDSLLKGLLKLSRLGRAALNIDRIDMNNLIAAIVKTFEFQLQESGAKIECEELPSCFGDEVQINQVFSNLIGNALKYRDPNRETKIRISGSKKGGNCNYCVEDNGIGMAESHQEKIFEIFHRLQPGDTEGEGLGLTIVYKILERHNGRIWLESEPGEGSRFFVRLPNEQFELFTV